MSSAGFSKKDSAAVRITSLQTFPRKNNSHGIPPARNCSRIRSRFREQFRDLRIHSTLLLKDFSDLTIGASVALGGYGNRRNSKNAEINFGNSDGLGSFRNYGDGTGGTAIAD